MKGLELSKQYYLNVGRPMIEKDLPEVLPYLAAGLCGEGSECLGFDDGISQDHDFGPGFCIWLEPEAYNTYGQVLQELYDLLPGEYAGYGSRKKDLNSGKRVGVFSIPEFYSGFLGTEVPPGSLSRWYLLEESRLAACTSGAVFEDNPGTFSGIRALLLSHYPAEVRINKIAACVHLIAQSGQYNYARCMERGDTVAAEISLSEFIRNVIHLVHLLSRIYEPYYKWSWKSFTLLPDAAGLISPLKALTELPVSRDAWSGSRWPDLNLKDQKVILIESICRKLLELLKKYELTEGNEAFLEAHVNRIASLA